MTVRAAARAAARVAQTLTVLVVVLTDSRWVITQGLHDSRMET